MNMGAQVLRKKGEILSGPVDLLLSSDSSSLWIPSVLIVMIRDGWVGAVWHVWYCRVFYNTNCVLSKGDLSSVVVTRVSLCFLSAFMLVVSSISG